MIGRSNSSASEVKGVHGKLVGIAGEGRVDPIPFPPEQAAIEASLQVIDRIKPIAKRAEELAAAVLPAARNEIFSAMR